MNLKGFYREATAKKTRKNPVITLLALRAKIEQDPHSLSQVEQEIYHSFMHRVHHGVEPVIKPNHKFIKI